MAGYDIKQVLNEDDGQLAHEEKVWKDLLAHKTRATRYHLGLTDAQKWNYNTEVSDYVRSGKAGYGAPVTPSAPLNPTSSADLSGVEGDKRFEPGFLDKVKEVCGRLGINPTDLLVCMALETAGTFRPSEGYGDGGSSATGLIQFLDSTAGDYGTTTAQLAKMSQIQQMDYVERYLKNNLIAKLPKGKSPTFADLYMSIIWPVAVPKEDSYIIFRLGDGYYEANKVFRNNSGVVTKAYAASVVWRIGAKSLGIK